MDSGTAPDGQLSADRLQAPSGGIPAAIQQAENFVVPGSLSAYLKNAASGEGQTRLVLVDPELTQLYASPDAWALPAEWTRFDKPTDPASTPLWVTFSHLAQWPIASLEDLLPVLPDASYYLRGVQWEAGMEKTLEIRGELGRRIVLVVSGYERETAQNADDASWLRASASVDVGRFRGEVDAAFMTHDFVRFAAQLEQLLNGSVSVATFEPLEEALNVRIEADRAGGASVSGALRDTEGTTLSFRLESDFSFLRPLRAQLAEVVAAFPVR